MENTPHSTKSDAAKCPFLAASQRQTAAGIFSNADWWPNHLNLKMLHQNSSVINPYGKDFNYAEEFKSIDLDALKKDIFTLMTDSQDWWYHRCFCCFNNFCKKE